MTIFESVAQFYHSPAEAQAYSTLLHNMWGVCLLAIAIAELLSLIPQKKNRWQFVGPSILLAMAILFLMAIIIQKGIGNAPEMWRIMWYFPHTRIHFFMAATHTIGAILALLVLTKRPENRLYYLLWPATFLVVGIICILHPHGVNHSPLEAQTHTQLGIWLILVAIGKIIYELTLPKNKTVFLTVSAVALMVAALTLILYKEPTTAYVYAFPPANNLSESQESYTPLGNAAFVYIYQDQIVPKRIRLKTGGAVTFVQVDSSLHSFASGPHPTHENYPPLNIGTLHKDEAKTVKFSTPGLFGFHDHLNDTEEKLQGKILVAD